MSNSEIPEVAGFLGLDRAVCRLILEDGFEDRETTLRTIADYEQYFLLAATRRQASLSLPSQVDLVWQRHMLDTRAYAEDCLRWAGGYLHRDGIAPSAGFDRSTDRQGVLEHGTGAPLDPAPFPNGLPSPNNWGDSCETMEEEDLSGVLARVRIHLESKVVATSWVTESKHLLEANPDLAIGEYKRFLSLLINGEGPLTPSKLVDEFWHQHILDSRSYFSFCRRFAGRYLHHDPSYEKAHQTHERCFRRAKVAYKKHFGIEASEQVWAHMGDSEGGGDAAAGTPPAPLYAINRPYQVRVHLQPGAVDRRHYKKFHKVFEHLDFPKEDWWELLNAIAYMPRISKDEFQRRQGWSSTGSIIIIELFVIFLGVCLGSWWESKTSLENWSLFSSIMSICYFVSIINFFLAFFFISMWQSRPYDQEELLARVAYLSSKFSKYPISIRIQNLLDHCLRNGNLIPNPTDPSMRRHYDLLKQKNFVVIDATISLVEYRRHQAEQLDLERLAKEAKKARTEQRQADRAKIRRQRRAENAERQRQRRVERDSFYLDRGIKPGTFAWFRWKRSLWELSRAEHAKSQLHRQAERDAYYLDRGIKPGAFAWFRILSDLNQALLLGLAIGFIFALALIYVVYAQLR